MRRFIATCVLAVLVLLPAPTLARRSLPATDDFNRDASTLGNPPWTAVSGAITDWVVFSDAIPPHGTYTNYGGADYAAAYWNADSFGNDQYSQAIARRGGSGFQGLGVRLSAGPNGYFVTLESGCTIYKWVSGSRSSIGSCSVTWTDGHTLKIAVVGNAITVTDNGATIGTATDGALSSGAPGIVGYSDGSTHQIADWQGDMVAGGPTFPAAIINALIRCCGPRW